MKRVLLIVGGIVLLGIILCAVLVGGGVFAIFQATQPVVDAGDKFMTALRDGNYQQAYDMAGAQLQKDAQNAQGLETALSSFQPKTWTFTSRNINNNQGQLEGTTTYANDTAGTVTLTLEQVGSEWKVIGANFK